MTGSSEGWFSRLKNGLARTRVNIVGLFSGGVIDDDFLEELEYALITADVGVQASTRILQRLRDTIKLKGLKTQDEVRLALRDEIARMLAPAQRELDIEQAHPLVIMMTGVNGAGKTTSIGKISKYLSQRGKSVLLAAGDTFRAAAREQLAVWGDRNQIEVIAQQGGDPAAVVFDAVSAGKARGTDVVIADTAGRLPTQINLMEELRRIRRAQDKAMTGAPHEAILVVDGTNGQNALTQVKAFDAAVGLTGLIVTKLDGTAKGGVLVAITQMRPKNPLPIYFIGVGEAIDDLQPFNAVQFANALVGLDPNTPATAPE
jgi:fused signal recognition particle receptor